MTRTELVELVTRIMRGGGTEEDQESWIALLEANVPHPCVTDLIFYPEGPEPTPEEVVDVALSYQPLLAGGP